MTQTCYDCKIIFLIFMEKNFFKLNTVTQTQKGKHGMYKLISGYLTLGKG